MRSDTNSLGAIIDKIFMSFGFSEYTSYILSNITGVGLALSITACIIFFISSFGSETKKELILRGLVAPIACLLLGLTIVVSGPLLLTYFFGRWWISLPDTEELKRIEEDNDKQALKLDDNKCYYPAAPSQLKELKNKAAEQHKKIAQIRPPSTPKTRKG